MYEILEKAGELGQLIRETRIYKSYREMSGVLDAEPDSRAMLDEFLAAARDIQKRQEMGDIIEKFEEEHVSSLSAMISQNESVMKFLKAQKDYLELLLLIQGELGGDGGE